MMDTLDKFVTVRDGDVVLRLHKDEAPVLQEYALPLAHQALSTLSARYEFTPKGPILIEIFPKHDDFAVRNVGLPGMIGALGACFGRVVTMDSPKARPPGEFQWEATLWHELAHVITLQMSNQRVPRWLTEGISVYEEKRRAPEWGREMDVEFAGMLNRGETLKLRDLNAAFPNPQTISLAYFQASLLVEHLVDGLRRRRAAQAAARRTARGSTPTRRSRPRSTPTSTSCRPASTRPSSKMFGAHARALATPDGRREHLRDAARAAARRSPTEQPAQLSRCRWRSAARCARPAQPDEAMQAFERAAALVPMARRRRTARTRRWPRSRSRRRTPRAPSPR